MFKKGQLVKCADGKHGVIELKSALFPGEYIVTVQKGERSKFGGIRSGREFKTHRQQF